MTCTCRVQEAIMAALTQAGHEYQHLLPLPDLPCKYFPFQTGKGVVMVFSCCQVLFCCQIKINPGLLVCNL
jgi:hypothetical protein